MTGIAKQRMKELFKHEPRLDYKTMAKTLNDEGHRTPKGEIFTAGGLSYHLIRMGLRRFKIPSRHHPKKVVDGLANGWSDALVEIQMVLEMGVADERKYNLIKIILK